MPSSLFSILAPMALMLAPAARTEAPPVDALSFEDFAAALASGSAEVPPLLSRDAANGVAETRYLMESWRQEQARQVRIEQRLIIRIAPRAGADVLSAVPSGPAPRSYYERRTGRCLPVQGIAGVQVADDRLVLFMRDHRIIGANLEKACRPRDFYSGFYVEQTSDGQICAGRDPVHSRAGATCTISGLRELIPND